MRKEDRCCKMDDAEFGGTSGGGKYGNGAHSMALSGSLIVVIRGSRMLVFCMK